MEVKDLAVARLLNEAKTVRASAVAIGMCGEISTIGYVCTKKMNHKSAKHLAKVGIKDRVVTHSWRDGE